MGERKVLGNERQPPRKMLQKASTKRSGQDASLKCVKISEGAGNMCYDTALFFARMKLGGSDGRRVGEGSGEEGRGPYCLPACSGESCLLLAVAERNGHNTS